MVQSEQVPLLPPVASATFSYIYCAAMLKLSSEIREKVEYFCEALIFNCLSGEDILKIGLKFELET